MSPTKSPAKPVKATNTVDLLKRLTILSLIRDAFHIGIQVRSIPITPQKCTRIVKEILQKLRPDFHCVPRYYCVAKTRTHRLKIGDYQVTMCPWAVEIIPLTNEVEKVPVVTDACKIIPYEMGKGYDSRIVKGPIGAYANSNGFDLLYMTQRSGNIIIWAGSKDQPAMTHHANHKEEVRILMRSMISPLAFCRCVAYIYDELKGSGKVLGQAQKDYKTTQKVLGELFKQKKVEEPKEFKATMVEASTAEPQAVLVKTQPIVAKKVQKKPEDHDEIRGELQKLFQEMLK